MLKKSQIAIIGLILAALFSSAEEESVSMMFEKAVYAEETVGDLDAAIKIYEEIIEKEESNRTYAAQAHYRLGMCYLKKGKNEEAEKVLNALIDLYPDQSDLVKRTKDKLTDLNKYKADPIIRRVFAGILSGAPLLGGDLSRNGRTFIYGDALKDIANLCVLDLATGEKRYITNNLTDDGWIAYSIVSSDGKEIAYQWYKDNVFELRTIRSDGSNRKVLIHKDHTADYNDIEPVEWSPDCSNILVYLPSKSFSGFALVSTNDGSIRNLNPLNNKYNKWEMNVSFSPDGRYLAFNDSRKSMPDLKNDLYIVDVATGQETPLSKHPADDILVGWSPDGDKILFTSDRTPKRSLWTLELRDGLPHGNPVMLHNQFDGKKPQVNEEGTIFYTLSSSRENVYLTELNETGDSIDGSSSNASVNYINSCWLADWSPDGKQIAYLAKDVFGRIVIVIQLLETGEERILEFEGLNNAITRSDGVRWSPDGENLVFVTFSSKEGGSLFIIDAKTGDSTRLLNVSQLSVSQLEQKFLYSPLWDPEGNYIYLKQGLGRILRYNIEIKQVEEIYESENQQYSLALSSDGKWLAFFEHNQDDDDGQHIYSLQIISTQDKKKMHEILRLSENEYRTNDVINNSNSIINWTPDGKYLLYKKNSGNDELDVGLWRVNVETGQQHLIADLSDIINLKENEYITTSFRLHPDGRRIAYSTVLSTFDIWAMENILDR